jgi:hypothetical protein
MELSTEPLRKYNQLERKLFAAIPQDGGRVNLKQLIFVRLKHNPEWDVKHPRNILSTIMIRLAQKIADNDEPFKLCREGVRREQVWYWLEPKGTRRSSPAGSIKSLLFS